MAATCRSGWGGMVLVLLAAGCHTPTGSAPTMACSAQPGTQPRIAASSQVIASGSDGTTLTQVSGSDPVFADLAAMMAAPDGPVNVQQVGPMTQVSSPAGQSQTIQAAPNPATNLQGFLGHLFNQVGIGGQPGPGIQQGISQGSGVQQSIQQSSMGGPGMQQSSSMSSSVGGGHSRQVITNADGTVTVQEAGPAGQNVWRTQRRTFLQTNQDQPIRSETTTVTRDGPCQETTRNRTMIVRPDGTRRDLLSISKEDTCTGESLGDVRAQVRLVEGRRQLVGAITHADGTVRPFTHPLP